MSSYEQRIKQAVDLIDSYYSESLKLEDIASASNLSVYHFSRIFLAATGLTPMRYLKEVRLEHSAALLTQTDMPVTEVAFNTGFGSISSFNASFKERYGITPGDLRARKDSNFPGVSGKISEAETHENSHTLEKSLIRRVWDMNVTVKEFSKKRVAYSRHIGSYLDTAGNWQKLLDWVGRNGLFRPSAEFIGISLDDPETTEDDACRHDACITLPERFNEIENEDIAYQTLPGGTYAVYRFHDTIDKLLLAFRSLYLQWLPESGYEADDRPVMEINLNNPADDPEHKSMCDVCIPVRKI